jgi:hypothetical protein
MEDSYAADWISTTEVEDEAYGWCRGDGLVG